ncbi:MAG: 1-acyl-sn-glycerol-3-phosphate acyltransferase [Solirubrobacteraceae bacterium]|nr:1-acyl-sn-glycerol-3-phosphate acyltransferase [Solirubrobacteraceae bacterium]
MTSEQQGAGAEPGGGEPLVRIREQVYVDPRPPQALQRYYDWPMTHRPDWIYDAVRVPACLFTWALFRPRTSGAERIPGSGPVIFAPNHFSNIDHFFLGGATRRKIQFMAKSQLYKGIFAWIMKHGGVFPVRRGHGDDQSFAVANSILERGGAICLYCEGGRSRTGRLAARPKTGIGRVALQSGATVMPVAIHGSQRVRNWKRLQFPRISVLYGEPLRFERVAEPTHAQSRAAAEQIFDEIKALYAQLGR